MYVADKKMCHPDSPTEEFVAPASRNAGIKPSAGSAYKDCLIFKELHPATSSEWWRQD